MELPMNFLSNLAVLGVGLFRRIEDTKIRGLSIHHDARCKLPGIVTGNPLRKFILPFFFVSLVSGVLAMAGNPQVFPSVIKGITVNVVDDESIRDGYIHKRENNPVNGREYLATSILELDAKADFFGFVFVSEQLNSSNPRGVYGVESRVGVFPLEVPRRASSPEQLSANGIVNEALIEVLFRRQFN